ncbi:hypothetical protein LUZ61_006308 [Rhynchospora tenuis]|uniref:Uncharacterized protein n=1 Tax=Rhynchospora tenuis TaxID=198213 RepID=A0AAD5ZRG0_9POAL|nr:hypothetical protein LUZ61_006308 [Rhynchospora tenuis]
MTSEDRNTEDKNMFRVPAMSYVRSFISYYRRSYRSLSACETHSPNLDVVPRYRGYGFLDQRRFLSANQHDKAETSRSISAVQAIPGSATPPPPSGGPPIFTWLKLAIGSVFTLLLPFLYTQWKNILKIGGEIETAKEVVEKTAEAVEKVADMAEKASKEAAESMNDGTLKEAAEIVEQISEKVEEDARIVEDIIHKVDEIEEDVKTLIEPVINPSKHEDDGKSEHDENKPQDELDDDGKSEHDENKPKDEHDESKPQENVC